MNDEIYLLPLLNVPLPPFPPVSYFFFNYFPSQFLVSKSDNVYLLSSAVNTGARP